MVEKNKIKFVDGVVGCPDECKYKDVMCMDCVDGCYFDADAQD